MASTRPPGPTISDENALNLVSGPLDDTLSATLIAESTGGPPVRPSEALGGRGDHQGGDGDGRRAPLTDR